VVEITNEVKGGSKKVKGGSKKVKVTKGTGWSAVLQ